MKIGEGEYCLETGTNENILKNNTEYLQKAIDKVSESGGGTIYLPKGTYYFKYGGQDSFPEYWVIECKNNVTIIGQGTGTNGTILKPYGEVEERWYRYVFLQ